ncbi:MAG: hypothetical protein ACPGYT_01580 [Nitrospirales bacterium]
MVPLIKLAIFTATRWEYRSVRQAFLLEQVTTIAGVPCAIGSRGSAQVFVFQSGIGPHHALEVSQAVLHYDSWNLVISSGFAGALVPSTIGTIVVGQEVVLDILPEHHIDSCDRQTIVCDETFREFAFHVASSLDGASQSGPIATLPRIIGEASEKKAIAARTQAIALDMESAVLGHVAQRKDIPFIVIRTISDLVEEDLPINFNLFLRPRSWAKGVCHVLQRPASLMQIPRLRKQMLEASVQLVNFFQKFFDEIDPVRQ